MSLDISYCTNCNNPATGTDDEGSDWCDSCGDWNLSIGGAVELLKARQGVCRRGWNGKGMYLYLTTEFNKSEDCWLPFVVLVNAQGKHVPWNASQADLLAVDWMRIDEYK